jgi:hypothetical protein
MALDEVGVNSWHALAFPRFTPLGDSAIMPGFPSWSEHSVSGQCAAGSHRDRLALNVAARHFGDARIRACRARI